MTDWREKLEAEQAFRRQQSQRSREWQEDQRHMEKTRAHMAKLAGTTPAKIGSLAMGQYVVKIGAFPSYTLSNDPDLIDDRNAMPDERWREIVAEQLRRYYRPLGGEISGSPPLPLGEIDEEDSVGIHPDVPQVTPIPLRLN